jgi:Spy/CpxP family protein refolding chaperone
MRWVSLSRSVLVLVVGLSVAGVSGARPPFGGHRPDGGHHRDHGPERFIEEHAAELGLDDETRQAIDQIVDESRERARGLHAELQDLHREMRDLLSQDAPDESAVMQQAEAIGEAETELHKHRLGALIRIRALLTDEQRAELTRIREEAREQWLKPATLACQADADHFCPDAEDHWSRGRCLRDRWEELSPGCRDAIEASRSGARGRLPGRPGPDGPGGMDEL